MAAGDGMMDPCELTLAAQNLPCAGLLEINRRDQ